MSASSQMRGIFVVCCLLMKKPRNSSKPAAHGHDASLEKMVQGKQFVSTMSCLEHASVIDKQQLLRMFLNSQFRNKTKSFLV